MATTHTDTNVNQLVINKMTKQEYDNLQQVSDTELYLVEESLDNVVTQNSTNPVQSGAVYNAIQDIEGTINDGTTTFTKNNETIGTISANQALDKTIKIPNDVVMCKMSDGIVYDSYITYTKIKQYLPDYPYYSDNLNWEIGGNPPMRASITEGDYYLDVDTNHIFVADENIELVDVTSSVVIQGDTNKLYCDTNTNQLYRYDGSNFVALTSEGKTYTLSSNDENIRLTDSDGQIQDLSLNTLINGLSTENSDPQDNDYIISQYVNGGTTTTTYHRRPLSKFWNWIKTKLGIGTNDGTFLRKDGTWATPTATDSTKVAKAGDSMSGTLTFTTANAINYNANNGNINMIRFKTGDADGHGIIIGGGGLTVIGAGESATTVAAQTSSGGSETMQVCSDANIEFYTNCQSGFSSAKKSYLDTSGNMYVNGSQVRTGTVAIANGGTGATTAAAARTNLGLGSAATLTANTAASNSTVVQRNSSGYVYANYFNTTCTEANPSSYTNSRALFTSDDGFIRKASAANFRTMIGAGTSSLTIGTTGSTACAGNDSRLSNSRPASDVYDWAKSASLQAAMQSNLTSGSVTSMSNGSCNISWKQVGNIVYFSGYIKPTSTSFSVAVPGTYKQTVDFPAINKNLCQIFTLTTTGYIKNSTVPDTGNTYYFQCIGIKVI